MTDQTAMYQPVPNYDFTLTVPIAGSQSPAVDIGDMSLLGFICPAAIEATTVQLSLQASPTLAGAYTQVYADGVRVTLPFTVNNYALFDNYLRAIFIGLRFIKITLETAAGVAVAQATAARVFTLITRKF